MFQPHPTFSPRSALSPPTRRRFLCLGLSVSATALLAGRPVPAEDTSCSLVHTVRLNAAREIADSQYWAVTEGRDTLAYLAEDVAKARRQYDALRAREEDLEAARMADIFSTVVTGATTAIGIGVLTGFVTLSAPASLAVFAIGGIAGLASTWAQVQTDPNASALASGADWAGNTFISASTVEELVPRYTAANPPAGFTTVAVSSGLAKAAGIAGAVFGVYETGSKILEWRATDKDENKAEDLAEEAKTRLDELEAEFAKGVSLQQVAEMRAAAAQAVLEDFESIDPDATSCDDIFLPGVIVLPEALAGAPSEDTGADGSTERADKAAAPPVDPDTTGAAAYGLEQPAATDGPVIRTPPERTKRIQLERR